MFSTHNINSNQLSIRNLILLFLTIVFGFASVITLGQGITIPTSIQNARQTIAKITITDDGTDTSPRIEFSSGGIYIDDSILDEEPNFSGKVLGIDDAGNVIYVLSENLVVSGAGGGIGGDGLWTGTLGGDIRNLNSENVGIGTSTMSGKLHIKSSGETNIYIEETSPINAANLNLKTINNRWMVGAYDQRFYIGLNSTAFLNITTGGRVGIGTTNPKANLHVIGNFIAGQITNVINGQNSTIAGGISHIMTGDRSFIGGGGSNHINGNESSIEGGNGNKIVGLQSSLGGGVFNIITGNHSFIGGGYGNKIDSWNAAQSINVIVGGRDNTIEKGWYTFIGGGSGNKIKGMYKQYSIIVGGNTNTIDGNNSSIVGGENNEINSSNYASIVGGQSNEITSSARSFIGGGYGNIITGTSRYSVIPGGQDNRIENAKWSFVVGTKAYNTGGYSNTFVRNSDQYNIFYAGRQGSFLINVPFQDDPDMQKGGVGINTNNPRAPLDVDGIIRTRKVNTPLPDCPGLTNDVEGSIAYDGNDFRGCTIAGRQQLNN